jgi:lauroyl/myristoyl acyltransferase
MELKSNSETAGPSGSPRDRRYRLSRILRSALRAIPLRYRFRSALWAARMLVPVIRRTALYRERRKSIVDGSVEIALYIILAGLTRDGTEFEPRLRITGFELFEAALRSGKGVLVISAHGMLGLAFWRYLVERGHQASIVSPAPHYFLGRRVPIPIISPGRTYLFEIRERFRKGEVIGAMIDRARAKRARTFTVETRDGTVHLANALVQVAANATAEVIFLRSWVESGAIAIELAAPSPTPERDADSITRDFAQFIQRHVSTRANS